MAHRAGAVVFLALAGCAVVLPADKEETYASIDADDDGSPGVEDCDDADPLRSPGRPEVVADGIDNDCDGADLLDADGDGYPLVDRATYIADLIDAGLVTQAAQVSWPSNVNEGPADCDDSDGDIHPDRFDPPYDGIDADCDRGNDFDADRDGQMPVGTDPDAVRAYADALGLVIDLEASLAFADCNDERAEVFAGAPSDVPYDGHDGDCDGTNDFDIDGDGYLPDGFESSFAVFVDRYHPDPTTAPAWVDAARFGDCLDQAHPQVPLAPEQVHPGAPEVAYDGVDADCAGDSDFDADLDGFTSDAHHAAISDYRQLWSVGDPPGFTPTLAVPPQAQPGDCDDTRATVAPGQVEQLGDTLDADCDGGIDSTPLAFGEVSWAAPGRPRIAATDAMYVVADVPEELVRYLATGNQAFGEPGVAVTFAREPALPGYRAEPFGLELWANANPLFPAPLDSTFELLGGPGHLYQTHTSPQHPNEELRWSQQTYQPQVGGFGSPQQLLGSNGATGASSDVDAALVLDQAGLGWGLSVACGGAGRSQGGLPVEADGTVRLMAVPTPFDAASSAAIEPGTNGLLTMTANTADVCWMRGSRLDLDTVRAEVHVCDLDGCLEVEAVVTEGAPTIGSVQTLGPSPYSGRGIVSADVNGPLLVTIEDAGLVLEHEDGTSATLFPDEPLLAADAVLVDGFVYTVAVVADAPTNRVEVVYGSWSSPSDWVEAELPVYDDDPRFLGGFACEPATGMGCEPGRVLDPTGVAVHADDDRVIVAVAARPPDTYVTSEPQIAGGAAPQGAVGWSFFVPAP